MTDPFPRPADEAQTQSGGSKVATESDNFVSVSFKLGGGYDAPMATIHGTEQYVAGLLGVKDFTGKISQILQGQIKVDDWAQGEYRTAAQARGKA